MPTCFVCLDTLKDPAALPCGHVFCHTCILRVIRTITPYTHHHFCPTCKHPYTISQVDPAMVPPHLQHHISPAVRKLHLEYTMPSAIKGLSPSLTADQLRADNASLRSCCSVWRKRAAVHATATLGLVGLARLARDSALKMKAERDDLQTRYNELKRRFEESQILSTFPPQAETQLPTPPAAQQAAEPRRNPVVMSPPLSRSPSPAASEESYYSDCPECRPKRKRVPSESTPPLKRSRSSSLHAVPVLAPVQETLADYLVGRPTV
ncbi:hypothetical protein B0H21DRAFT_351315 [Amylocystis lapponica]|nr:hypothetical protein B0H21DRAFT_351315 [Amylocystis lapponica]